MQWIITRITRLIQALAVRLRRQVAATNQRRAPTPRSIARPIAREEGEVWRLSVSFEGYYGTNDIELFYYGVPDIARAAYTRFRQMAIDGLLPHIESITLEFVPALYGIDEGVEMELLAKWPD